MREAGLYDEFLKYARFDGEALCVTDKDLKVYLSAQGSTKEKNRGMPEIDRLELRQMLAKSLPSDTIRWNCRLRKIDPEDMSLHFDHGIEKDFDLIVGADGAWSKVRPLLTDAKPFYAGIGGYDMFIDDAENRYPDLHKLVNRGSLFAHADHKTLGAQQMGDGSIYVRAYGVVDEDWERTRAYDIHNSVEVKKAILEEYADWAEPLVKIVRATRETDIAPRCLYMLPIGVRWKHRSKVTIIGDAAHLMTPYAGEGVNAAMKDAMVLAHAIIESTQAEKPLPCLDARVEAFEEEMFARVKPLQERSDSNKELILFVPGAPASTIHIWVRNAIGTNWFVRTFLPLWFVRLVLKLYFRF